MRPYLKKFLEDLPKQTIFDDIQVVLEHNDPTDEELGWVRDFSEKYPGAIKHIITRPVAPIGVSMNTCIDNSDGDYLAIWNVDDLRTNNSLASQAKVLDNNPDCDVANGNFIITKSFDAKKGQLVDHSGYCPGHKEYTRGMILGPFFMFRKSILQKSGKFDEQLKSGADFDLAVRLAIHNSNILFASEILGYYLDEGKGASTNGDGRQPTERTVVEMRYGVYDKIQSVWVDKAKSHNIKNILQNGKWEPIENFVPNYENFILGNK
jgi:glycosyltransferase involved in cell wall biosynthesis